jgi:SAM-dependent methyltransferase
MKQKFKVRCSSCYSKNLEVLFDFGDKPLAGYFPLRSEESSDFSIELRLLQCGVCHLVQIDPDLDDRELFADYRYLSKYSMQTHFNDLANWIESELRLEPNSNIFEIGSNDGTLQKSMRERGYEVIGVDPAFNVVQRAISGGFQVHNEFFSSVFVRNQNLMESQDLVISCNSFAHITDINEIAKGISEILRPRGIALIEVQAWPKLVETHSFDFIYHEHKYYYHLASIQNLMQKYDLWLKFVKHIPIHGGSYRLVFEKGGQKSIANTLISKEFVPSNADIRRKIKKFTHELAKLDRYLFESRGSGIKVVGFGAAGRGNMLLSFLKESSLLPFVLDESPERVGRIMGISGIPILDFQNLQQDEYDECLVLAWNHFDSIARKWPHEGKKLICPLPKFHFYNT